MLIILILRERKASLYSPEQKNKQELLEKLQDNREDD